MITAHLTKEEAQQRIHDFYALNRNGYPFEAMAQLGIDANDPLFSDLTLEDLRYIGIVRIADMQRIAGWHPIESERPQE